MNFVSTRGGGAPQSFCDIVLEGLCEDGGLAMPETIPLLSQEALKAWKILSYQDLAFEIMSLYCDDIPSEDLKGIIKRAYGSKESKESNKSGKDNNGGGGFSTPEVISIKKIDGNVSILGLSNGPTYAFKDIAMQFLGELFPYILAKKNKKLTILGATSGDTGSSAIHALKGKERLQVVMLSPYERMSAFQTAQMYSVSEDNIFNVAIKGVFDDCQDLVKTLNQERDFKDAYHLGAVNSINFARILAQIVYYFKGYFLTAETIGENIDFVIPSGNFGNIFAGIMARKMGLPIRNLILATNENNVLDEFFRTGVYKPRQGEEVHLTTSPSMDIAKASNFERFIYLIAGAKKTKELWQVIEEQGYFDLTDDPLWQNHQDWHILSGSSHHGNRLEMIQHLYHLSGELIDPHTADGLFVGYQYLDGGAQLLALETAKPIKFYSTMMEALPELKEETEDLSGKDLPSDSLNSRDTLDFALIKAIEALPQQVSVLDNDPQALKDFIQTHINP